MFLKVPVFFSLVLLGRLALADPSMPNLGYMANFSCSDGPFGLRLPSDVRSLNRLGTVLKRTRGEVTNWDSYHTTWNYLHYSGLDLAYVTFSNDPAHYMMNHVEVTGADWKITGPFKVGSSVKSVQFLLGSVADDDSQLKRQYGSESDRVTFEQVNGKVTKISYECYTG